MYYVCRYTCVASRWSNYPTRAESRSWGETRPPVFGFLSQRGIHFNWDPPIDKWNNHNLMPFSRVTPRATPKSTSIGTCSVCIPFLCSTVYAWLPYSVAWLIFNHCQLISFQGEKDPSIEVFFFFICMMEPFF